MKKIRMFFFFVLIAAVLCSCDISEIPPENEPVSENSESEVSSEEKSEYTEEDYDAVVKELGYTEEQLSRIENFFQYGLSPLAVMEPYKYVSALEGTVWPEGMEYSLKSFYFDPEVYADHHGPLGFIYLYKDKKISIIPEIPGSFTKWDVIDSEYFYFGDSGEIRIYNINDISEPCASWSIPEEKLDNKDWSPILTSASSESNGEVIVIWVNRPADFDAPLRGENLDKTNYMITILDTDGNVIGEYDTGLKIKIYSYGLSDVVVPEIVATAENKVLFKVHNVHYVFDYKAEAPAAEQYIFTEEDVVQYSNVDFESDFAESAIKAVEDYITENYSANDKIESFSIQRAEVDEHATNSEINLIGGTLVGRYDSEDYLNGFLVIRTRTDVYYVDKESYDSSDEDAGFDGIREYKYYILYDPENKYDNGRMLGESGWKIIDGSNSMFDTPEFDDERFYIAFEEGKIS